MEPDSAINQQWQESMNEAKPYHISKWEVWEAYQRVRANQGAATVPLARPVDLQSPDRPRLPSQGRLAAVLGVQLAHWAGNFLDF